MGARSTAASVVRHVGGVAAEASLIAALVATIAIAFSAVYVPAKFVAGTDQAFAAKGGHRGAAATLACTVSPDPVSTGGMYTVTGTGYAPNTGLLVQSQDSVGSQYISTVTDSTGTFHASSYASWPGTYAVSVLDTSGQKTVVLGTCSFTAG